MILVVNYLPTYYKFLQLTKWWNSPLVLGPLEVHRGTLVGEVVSILALDGTMRGFPSLCRF